MTRIRVIALIFSPTRNMQQRWIAKNATTNPSSRQWRVCLTNNKVNPPEDRGSSSHLLQHELKRQNSQKVSSAYPTTERSLSLTTVDTIFFQYLTHCTYTIIMAGTYDDGDVEEGTGSRPAFVLACAVGGDLRPADCCVNAVVRHRAPVRRK